MNEFITVPWSIDLFSYTNGAYEFSVKFCVVKFSSFGWKIWWIMEQGGARA